MDKGHSKVPYGRKPALALCGQLGAHLASLISLSAMFATRPDYPILAEMAAAVVLTRVAYCLSRGSNSILSCHGVRRNLRQVLADEVVVTLGLAACCFLLQWPVGPAFIGMFFAVNMLCQSAITLASKKILNALCRRMTGAEPSACKKQVLIVGTGGKARTLTDMILEKPELDTAIIGFLDFHRKGLWRYRDIPLVGHPDEAGRLITNCQVDALLIAVDTDDLARSKNLFAVAETMGVPICFSSGAYEPSIARVRGEQLGGLPLLIYCSSPESRCRLAVKSLIDKVGALCGLILGLPFILLAAIAIKLDSRGPVLFRQVRSGINGRPFCLYKFRTMCQNAERMRDKLADRNEMSGPVFKIREDPRVTRVGRILRKTSLDEVPQLFNVLKGDMSLVGPRPPLPSEVTQYEPWQRRRLSVRPGVTCTWQTTGRNNLDFEQWMGLDLTYIDNWSLLEDTRILVRTIPAVLKGSGAS